MAEEVDVFGLAGVAEGVDVDVVLAVVVEGVVDAVVELVVVEHEPVAGIEDPVELLML